MKNDRVMMKPVIWARWAAAAALAMAALCPPQALAQVPARFYWKSLSGANAVPVIFNSLSGNTNPFDPSNLVTPNANIEATMALTGWAHTYTLFDRAGLRAAISDRISRNEGVILLQNRRGFAPFVECGDCGHAEECEHCQVTMTYHLSHKHLRCHYCGSVRPMPGRCPSSPEPGPGREGRRHAARRAGTRGHLPFGAGPPHGPGHDLTQGIARPSSQEIRQRGR